MSDITTLVAQPRDRAGKGVARATRREGRVPAVIYGGKEPPVLIALELKDMARRAHGASFFTHLLEINVDGKKHRVLPRDVQFHPLKDHPIHVDFLRVATGATIEVAVPVEFINQEASPGLKRGGVLNIVRHEVELICPVEAIPEHITIDMTGFDVGDSVHIGQVKLPPGVTPAITDRDFTIATVTAPSGLKSADAAADAAEAETAAAAKAASAPAAPAKAGK
ncbi:MAG: rplY [Rhodospirillales bacterium]|nr:rplY [Rhodospirillales bacterium]